MALTYYDCPLDLILCIVLFKHFSADAHGDEVSGLGLSETWSYCMFNAKDRRCGNNDASICAGYP